MHQSIRKHSKLQKQNTAALLRAPIEKGLLVREKKENNNLHFQLLMSVLSGSGVNMLQSCRNMLDKTSSAIVLPTVKNARKFIDKFRLNFMKDWQLQNTPTGMRCNLICAVKWVAKHCYGLDTLNGLRIDIWGDGMARGNRDVTRLCFRILGTSHQALPQMLPIRLRKKENEKKVNLFNSQSRKETFCFAVFIGKDSRHNLEINLGPTDRIGDHGWLYIETYLLSKIYKASLIILKRDFVNG